MIADGDEKIIVHVSNIIIMKDPELQSLHQKTKKHMKKYHLRMGSLEERYLMLKL
jgi:hypothetical protein